MPSVYDQGSLGSCTANASGAAFEFDLIKQKLQSWIPSRLAIYYDERVIEGTVKSDSGAQIRDAVRVLATKGVGPETLWPYVPSKFTTPPPATYIKVASSDKALQYARVEQTQTAIEECLFKGFPIIFGFTVYASFESEAVAKTGIVPMPAPTEECLGGHAVLAVGYERSKRMIIVRNSWSPQWGDKGYFYMPYAYMLNANLTNDLWALYSVEENGKPA
jgi:C1A family cysteine protease